MRTVRQSRLRGRRKLIGPTFLSLSLAPKPNLAEEERSDQRQDQHGAAIEEDVVQRPSEPGPERMNDLVEDGGGLRSSGRGCGGAAGRDGAGIKDGLRAARAAGNKPTSLRRQVEAGDLRLDARGQSRGQQRAEYGRANRAADLPPELDLAGRNAEELAGPRGFGRPARKRGGG